LWVPNKVANWDEAKSTDLANVLRHGKKKLPDSLEKPSRANYSLSNGRQRTSKDFLMARCPNRILRSGFWASLALKAKAVEGVARCDCEKSVKLFRGGLGDSRSTSAITG
jgi:hypothetical protein